MATLSPFSSYFISAHILNESLMKMAKDGLIVSRDLCSVVVYVRAQGANGREQQNYLFIRLSAFFIESNLKADKWLIN